MTLCYICHKVSPVLHNHHVWMQSAGGELGPTVDLCPTCHQLIHSCALSLLSKKAKPKKYFTDEEMVRAKPLIQYICMALQKKKEGSLNNTKSKIIIDVDAQFLLLLHTLKADAGHSNLSTFCANVLRSYARKRI